MTLVNTVSEWNLKQLQIKKVAKKLANLLVLIIG